MANSTTDNNFDNDVLGSSKPVLVDFWAEWCGPCRQLTPTIDAIAEEMGDKVDVYKVNIDENPEAPSKYGVRSIPTLILFKDGKPLATKVGAAPKTTLVEWIKDEAEVA